MQAITYKDYGSHSVLTLSEVSRPQPARDEVLIRVVAASVNPIDARLRSGEMRWMLPGGFPRIPGYDVAGVIEEVGKECSFQPGNRVLAFLDHMYGGGYAEYAVCSSSSVVSIPDEMSFEEASALPLAGSTALQSLRDYGHLKSGDRVLINGASGGVGAFAVQIAVARGAKVTAVASGKHEEFVRSLGATNFIDYTKEEFSKSNRQWELIFDAAGKSSFAEVKDVLSDKGHFVSTEPSLRGLVMSLITWPFDKQANVMLAQSREKDLKELVRLWSACQLKVTIEETFSLSEAAKAHHRIESDSFCGKLVLNA
ncbi:NAD(P)-dependent alcohol dehydrogenase [uncultured Rubinisphaera sp.]|uniref:NAD(P)-dependent alcohol dehydrogenase n=1 Tax=uncultured Rubinisphaera sp. TaxID=1678686 RepID=UPI0030D9B136